MGDSTTETNQYSWPRNRRKKTYNYLSDYRRKKKSTKLNVYYKNFYLIYTECFTFHHRYQLKKKKSHQILCLARCCETDL